MTGVVKQSLIDFFGGCHYTKLYHCNDGGFFGTR